MVGGAPLDLNKVYRLATNDFLLDGGDGYTALSGGRVLTNIGGGNLVANDVMAFVEKNGKVTNTVEGRIKILGK
jgi:2',3'-cyclic-nucleotide 2'-phosphodiesterase (5'-nucleotidase family)